MFYFFLCFDEVVQTVFFVGFPLHFFFVLTKGGKNFFFFFFWNGAHYRDTLTRMPFDKFQKLFTNGEERVRRSGCQVEGGEFFFFFLIK